MTRLVLASPNALVWWQHNFDGATLSLCYSRDRSHAHGWLLIEVITDCRSKGWKKVHIWGFEPMTSGFWDHNVKMPSHFEKMSEMGKTQNPYIKVKRDSKSVRSITLSLYCIVRMYSYKYVRVYVNNGTFMTSYV